MGHSIVVCARRGACAERVTVGVKQVDKDVEKKLGEVCKSKRDYLSHIAIKNSC